MENPLIGLFGRSSARADLEDAVRRRIIGPAPGPESPGIAPPTASLPSPTASRHEEESPALLLRNLADALKRTGVEIATVTAGNDGFLVHGALEGAAFRQWYSVQEVRQLGVDQAVNGIRPSS